MSVSKVTDIPQIIFEEISAKYGDGAKGEVFFPPEAHETGKASYLARPIRIPDLVQPDEKPGAIVLIIQNYTGETYARVCLFESMPNTAQQARSRNWLFSVKTGIKPKFNWTDEVMRAFCVGQPFEEGFSLMNNGGWPIIREMCVRAGELAAPFPTEFPNPAKKNVA